MWRFLLENRLLLQQIVKPFLQKEDLLFTFFIYTEKFVLCLQNLFFILMMNMNEGLLTAIEWSGRSGRNKAKRSRAAAGTGHPSPWWLVGGTHIVVRARGSRSNNIHTLGLLQLQGLPEDCTRSLQFQSPPRKVKPLLMGRGTRLPLQPSERSPF